MASAVGKISFDGYVGHPNDVVVGKAKVCFNEFKGVWVKPGGGMIFTKSRAEKFCAELDNILSGVKKT